MFKKDVQSSKQKIFEQKIKKLITRLSASIFALLIVLIVSGFFVFSSINLKMIAQALTGNYGKTTGGALTANEWNNIANDFVNKSGDTMTGNLTVDPGLAITRNGKGIYFDPNDVSLPRAQIKSDLGMGMVFYTNSDKGANGTAAIYITPDAKVGIGMESPTVALDVSGDIEYTGSITDVSDRRLKENITGIDNALFKLQSINGVYYNMVNSDKKEVGVIAQDVQKVLPEAVSIIDSKNGYLGVDYTSLTPVLIEAIKEQQKQIENLQAQLDALK